MSQFELINSGNEQNDEENVGYSTIKERNSSYRLSKLWKIFALVFSVLALISFGLAVAVFIKVNSLSNASKNQPSVTKDEVNVELKGETTLMQHIFLDLAAKNISALQSDLETLRKNLTCFIDGPRPEKGWFAPSNGYQYRLTNTTQGWSRGRKKCQKLGGDLAAVGMRDLTTRRKIVDIMNTRNRTWIGLNDKGREGDWMWVDGKQAVGTNIKWAHNEPNQSSGNEDCVGITWPPLALDGAVDGRCTDAYQALCEKIVPKICS
ncbi:unnamed protein product [Clavelina lepadiformis]|uniref:C-type lectin domain-containing protein n=1 Tax=Clavelina lepadiformis TaxID=159417 RepID=A0ABP0GVG2_CLALP